MGTQRYINQNWLMYLCFFVLNIEIPLGIIASDKINSELRGKRKLAANIEISLEKKTGIIM